MQYLEFHAKESSGRNDLETQEQLFLVCMLDELHASIYWFIYTLDDLKRY